MKIRFTAPLLLATFAAPAFATDYTDEAEVISAVPMYQTVNEPSQQCWTESATTYEQPHRSGGGAIIGAITGGLLGHTVGKGNGRVAATAVGAAVGAMVGDHVGNQGRHAVPVTRDVQRCQVTDNVRQIVSGYQVTYRYHGRDTTVILPHDPGPRVRLGVGIAGDSGPGAIALTEQPVVRNITYVRHESVPVWHQPPRPRVNIVVHADRHGHHRDYPRKQWHHDGGRRGDHHNHRRDRGRDGHDRDH